MPEKDQSNLERAKVSLYTALGASCIVLSGLIYVFGIVYAMSSKADAAMLKALEVDSRQERLKTAFVEERTYNRKTAEELLQRTARMEGMLETLLDKKRK